ncbi:MAG: HAD family hydrolase [Cyanobacteriota bacterium]|nr:HAD family hydrolase [Cyanobacteriota bacterium]
MSQLQALIFDIDGTLAETERDGHRVAFNRAFAEEGLDWEWQVPLYDELLLVTGGKERLEHYLKEYLPDFAKPDDFDEFIARVHAAKTRHYADLLDEGAIPLRPGVKRLLTEARSRGCRLAIATTSAYPNVLGLLDKHLDRDWFEVIGAGDMVPDKKPAPDVYQYVLDKLGLEAKDCVAFEDSEQGFAAASRVGLKTIITTNQFTENQNFEGALLVLDCLGEPDAPCRVIAGSTTDIPYLDFDRVVQLHQENVAR